MGGPKTLRETSSSEQLSGEECDEAVCMLKHTTDQATVKGKMRATFKRRQHLLHDPTQSSLILDHFPRFLDTPGLVRNWGQPEPYCTIYYEYIILLIDLFFVLRLTKTSPCCLEKMCPASLFANGQLSTSHELSLSAKAFALVLIWMNCFLLRGPLMMVSELGWLYWLFIYLSIFKPGVNSYMWNQKFTCTACKFILIESGDSCPV